ncbi:MAG: hypothetical protein OER82_02215 [Nitrosopumilus sp.]|nr:hypothetical protein [Nitrosopumilus sp.]
MNIYDTKTISCRNRGKSMGEIDYDAEVILPQCGQCANPMPEGDNITYTASYFQNNPPLKKSKIVESLSL